MREDLFDHRLLEDRRNDLQLAAAVRAMLQVELEHTDTEQRATRMVMQVHDELVLEVPEAELDWAREADPRAWGPRPSKALSYVVSAVADLSCVQEVAARRGRPMQRWPRPREDTP